MKKLYTLLLKNTSLQIAGVVIILFLQNFLIFYHHYLGRFGFPWDFPISYFPWVAYWTASIQQGVFPQWVPYASMGYPFFLQLQASLFYIPFWIFPLFHIPYTYQIAVITQCLHILFASVGLYFLVKIIVKDPRYAFISAIAFQFFGGFYSNAEHSDIIRTFAIAPWLLYSFTFYQEKVLLNSGFWRLPRRAVFGPIILFLFATGAYPGGLLAGCLLLGVYIIIQIIYLIIKNHVWKTPLFMASTLVLLSILGISMAFIHLGPSWVFRTEFTRFSTYQGIPRMNFKDEYLPGLILSNVTLPDEISMTSLYITLPVFMMIFLITLTTLKKQLPIFVLLLFAGMMITGTYSPLYNVLTHLIPPLAYSRFPIADYRAMVAIPLIILAMLGLKDFFEQKIPLINLVTRALLVFSFYVYAVYQVYVAPPWDVLTRANPDSLLKSILSWTGLGIHTRYVVTSMLVFMLAFAVLFVCWRARQTGLTIFKILLISSIIVLDGALVISDMYSWQGSEDYQRIYSSDGKISEFRNGEFKPLLIFTKYPATRPARQFVYDRLDYSWAGYIDGSYQMKDYKECPTRSCINIEANPILSDYMVKPWTAILLNNNWRTEPDGKVHIDENLIATSDPSKPNQQVLQTLYRTNSISYEVDLPEPMLFVENEIYFPGWEGKIISENHVQKTIKAIEVNNALRGWLLPAGNYQFEAEFTFPNLWTYVFISLSAFLVWLVLIVFVLIRIQPTAERQQRII